jgi:uncharacterized membrane protein
VAAFGVNIKCSRIFNRGFEVLETAQNRENMTKKRVFETRVSAFTIAVLTMISPYATLALGVGQGG